MNDPHAWITQVNRKFMAPPSLEHLIGNVKYWVGVALGILMAHWFPADWWRAIALVCVVAAWNFGRFCLRVAGR